MVSGTTALDVTSSLFTSVLVVTLQTNTVVSNVVEGTVHPSTVASHVFVTGLSGGAVDEFLLGEFMELSIQVENISFEGGDGREGPA